MVTTVLDDKLRKVGVVNTRCHAQTSHHHNLMSNHTTVEQNSSRTDNDSHVYSRRRLR